MKLQNQLLLLMVLLFYFQICESATGVCSRVKTRSVSLRVSRRDSESVRYRYSVSCWLFFRCGRTGYRTEYSTVYSRKYTTKYYIEEFCCLGYTGTPPNCRAVCPQPTEPRNGYVRYSSTTAGAVVRHYCNSNYRLEGSSRRTCLTTGVWSGTLPRCIRYCSSPRAPTNGRVSVNTNDVGGTATYSCNSGYRLSGGSSTRSCSHNGIWSGTQPYCQRYCSQPNPPTNGFISSVNTDVGGIATYNCYYGYGLSGPSSRTCSSTGSWSGSQPSCLRLCSTLDRPSNGEVFVNSSFPGGIANYTCNSGYGMSGESTRTCLSSGSWSGSQPDCVELCPVLRRPRNGVVSFDSNFPGGRATYSCNADYGLSGSSTRICLDGNWSGSEPSCLRLCPPLSNVNNGQVLISSYYPGGTATYSCNDGYGLPTSPAVRICSQSGSWFGSSPSCEKLCPALTRPNNGQLFISSYFDNGTATYTCHSGYRASGQLIHTCSNGSWSGSPPTCLRFCPELRNITNGEVSVSSSFPGGTAMYTCNSGYGINGPSVRTCSFNGIWYEEEPTCQMSCPELNPPANGAMTINSHFEGGIAVFLCLEGYKLYGDNFHICTQGSWSGIEPLCHRTTCPRLATPENGNVSVSSYLPGGTATYTCASGCYNTTNRHRICLEEGRWSGTAAICEPETCPLRECPFDNFGSEIDNLEEIALKILDYLNITVPEEDTCVLITAFKTLINISGIRPSERNYDRFTDAMRQITEVHRKCKEGEPVDIQELAEELAEQFSVNSQRRDAETIRSLFGEAICQRDIVNRRKKRQTIEECDCPPGGLKNSKTICELFKCLKSNDFKSVFGFEDGLYDIHHPCLAFVVDTTGSMQREINLAKEIIQNFFLAEEDFYDHGCYMLVPFNDVGPDHANVPDESIGPISVANTKNITELLSFYNAILTLKAIPDSGGDIQEYALDAIQDALQLKVEGDTVLWPGSQIIVLTDANSKNTNLKSEIVKEAFNNAICIHFFVAYHHFLDDDEMYREIAEKTDGTFVYPFSDWSLAKFISSYQTNPCDALAYEKPQRKKRSISRPSKCSSFRISQLATSFRFSAEAEGTVTLTSPSGRVTKVSPWEQLVMHAEHNPEAGEWRACVEVGTLNAANSESTLIDATFYYFNEGSSDKTTMLPTECSNVGVVLLTSKASQCGTQLNLNLLDPKRRVMHTVPMTGCGQVFIGNTTFPRGTYTYQITGTDSRDTPILINIKKVTFKKGKYSIEIEDSNYIMELSSQETVNCHVIIQNDNPYPSTFKLTAKILNVTVNSMVVGITVPAQKSARVTVPITSPTMYSQASSPTVLMIQADNGCATLTAVRTVRITHSSTTPPAPAATTPAAIECNCLNGGTCRMVTRRGRVYPRCNCPPGYRGSKCQLAY